MRFQTPSLVLLLVLLFFPVLPAHADESAPFGLKWGISVEELRNTGVRLYPRPRDESGERFAATNLPKALDDLKEVILSFGNDDKLHKVEAVSEDFRWDLDGTRVKARYNALSRALAAKYGKGETHHAINEPWTRPDNFLIGIHLGSSHYYTTFDSKTVKVRLEIRASRRDVGNYAIVFRYREPPPASDLSREKDVL
jgi:hypothetical protein